MAEYSRERRNQLSRAVANNKSGSRQLKGFVGTNLKNVIQLEKVAQLCGSMPLLNFKKKVEFTPKEVETYKEWLMSIYDLFSISSYIDAFLKIESFENPKIDIVKETHEIKEPIDDFIISLARKNMFFPRNMQIKIAYPVSSEGERFSWTSKYKYLAESTLQMVLEEFSHAYQDISNNFLSESTGKYQSKKRDSNKSDMDEVDILAYLMDRGLDVKKLGVVDRYACRRDYYIWRSGQERLELIPLATPIGKSFSPTPSRLKENKQPTKRPKDPMPPELIVKPLKLSPK